MKKLAGLLSLIPLTASAHDSHGDHLYQMISHVFSSPEHMWPLTLGLVAVAVIWFKSRS
jgi:hypothetical protein